LFCCGRQVVVRGLHLFRCAVPDSLSGQATRCTEKV
jgi:hypothetical protein